jgi:hypothetical protein
MWPLVASAGSAYGPFVADTMHVQQVVLKFTQSTIPLQFATCAP